MNLNNLFKLVDSLNWEAIRCLDGNCGHVPSELRGLIASDKTQRDTSYWKLDNHVVVQGGQFEGALFVLPFLLNLYENNTIPGSRKDRLYDLIFEIANGASGDMVNPKEKTVDGFTFFVPDGETEFPLQVACRMEVLKRINYFIKDVKAKQSETRTFSLNLLLSFYEYQFLVTNCLSNLIPQEKDNSFKEAIQKGIDDLKGAIIS